jgi:hypothetical protein
MIHGVVNPFCSLSTRRSIDLLTAMLDMFCGDAYLSLEGDLSQLDYDLFENFQVLPAQALDRNTIWPPQKLVSVALEAETLSIIKRHILPRVGIRKRILHIQIVKQTEMVFAAYDCFDRDLVGVINTVGEPFLSSLVERKAIWSYECKANDT